MSARPTFVFATFSSARDPRYLGWSSLRSSIAAGTRSADPRGVAEPPGRPPTPAEVDFSRVGIWRLLAPNNRELARSSVMYSSLTAAREHVHTLQACADDLLIVGVRGTSSSNYGWLATLGDEIIFTAGRWFGAPSTARHSASIARGSLERAVVSEGVWPAVRVLAHTRAGRGAAASGPDW